ncbi:MAG: signal recognition particle-docking protein FtsY [Lachnospiraceae bacterium]|nr:signal recognition particle-docking protein FtsY [Lachnospiraceae bacterium]
MFGFKKKNITENEQVVSEEVVANVETAPEADAAQVIEESPVAESVSETTSENVTDTVFNSVENTDKEDSDLAGTNEEVKKKGFFAKLKQGLTKTRDNIKNRIDVAFDESRQIDDEFYEDLEEALVMADVGIDATEGIIERLKEKVKERHIFDARECKKLLLDSIKEQMSLEKDAYDFENTQSVVLVIGVNGVGKTTTVGKLAHNLKDNGRKVMIVAADTFRAAATEQLEEWAKRADVDIISAQEGADPSGVVFDAVQSAKKKNIDTLICDTAGRLHNKKNLMEELKKMNRIIDREFPNAKRENFIVLDGTTGQNALIQAREFANVADLTGIIITKLDGTAKGGIVVAIQSELKIPVKYIGVGEGIEDLQRFDANAFVDALFE